MTNLWRLYGVVLALCCLAPFANQSFVQNHGFSLNFLYIAALILSFSIALLGGGGGKVRISVFIFLLFFLCLVMMNFRSDLGGGIEFSLLGVLVSLPLTFRVRAVFWDSLYKGVFFGSIIYLVSMIDSIEGLQAMVFDGHRTVFNNSPISTAILIGFLILSLLFYSRFSILLRAPVIITLLLFMLFTGSRGPFVSLLLVSLMLLVSQRNYYLIFVSLILALPLVYFQFTLRAHDVASGSARLELYSEALEFISGRPLGTFQFGGYELHSGVAFTHNIFLDLYVNTNVLMVLFFLSFTSAVSWVLMFSSHVRHAAKEKKFCIVVFLFIMFCAQFSLPSMELMRVIIPLMFLAFICCMRGKNSGSSSVEQLSRVVNKVY